MEQKQLIALLNDLSLDEKIGQMVQLVAGFYDADLKGVLTGPALERGFTQESIDLAGSILGSCGAEELIAFQKKYMEQHPHHIPMLFMMDIIHGMKTVFPIPLAMGATFDPELAEACAQVTAKEAAVSGLHVTFAPMVDLVRDARWGRVMESTGEDPWLNGQFAHAIVRGLQGENMAEPYRISACIKHFAAYGAPTAGREYNNVELSEYALRQDYLPAYEAGIEAGAGMVMTAFNTLNGIPASTNTWLMRDVLRGEMQFDGVLISDFGAIQETVAHGYSVDERAAAEQAIQAGVDIDMMDGAYASHIKALLADGKISMQQIDEAVLRILELKNKLGLFERPYKDADPKQEKQYLLCEEHRALARKAARESMVLLKNEGILPLKKHTRIACIGPYAESRSLNSSWAIMGEEKDCVSIRQAAEAAWPGEVSFYPGCEILDEGIRLVGFEGADASRHTERSTQELEHMFSEAVEGAKKADVVILCLGEHIFQSGEATSRACIEIPETQMRLFRAVQAVNPNIVTVVLNGRPLDLREVSEKSRAVLEAWRPGTEGGAAIWDVLTGVYNPSGCLPMSFPYCVGQVPVFYNEYATGRPYTNGTQNRFVSKYVDIPNEPLYPFGYGMSYTDFEIAPVHLDRDTLLAGETISAMTTVKNTGNREGCVTLQLYIRDISASRVRPVRELKGIRKVFLQPGEQESVCFKITEDMLRFYRADGTFGSEPGKFQLWVGRDSTTDNEACFSLITLQG